MQTFPVVQKSMHTFEQQISPWEIPFATVPMTQTIHLRADLRWDIYPLALTRQAHLKWEAKTCYTRKDKMSNNMALESYFSFLKMQASLFEKIPKICI